MFVYFIIIISLSQQFPTSSSKNQVELGEWATCHFMHCERPPTDLISEAIRDVKQTKREIDGSLAQSRKFEKKSVTETVTQQYNLLC